MNPPNSPEDEQAMALVCAAATAVVAIVAGEAGAMAYVQLKNIIRQIK